MQELNREIFVGLWTAARSGKTSDVADEAILQKYMLMHEDMHAHFDRIEQDPSASMEVGGENLMLHIAMDAATEKSLEQDEPSGVRMLMQQMLSSGFDPGVAFHVISQAMMHETIIAGEAGQEFEPRKFLHRAASYAEQAQNQQRPSS
jgi:hypothetical protein